MFNKMFCGFSAFMFMLIFNSCKKDPQSTPVVPLPAMEYFDLNDRAISENTAGFLLDVNHDGRNDLAFSTLLVGDPINQVDKLQFLIGSNIAINLPVNNNEEVPVMNSGATIPLGNFDGYRWFELSSVMLVQKITSFTEPPVWEGHWKNAIHKFLPFQVADSGKLYNGWVEISSDIAGEKMLLHKAALSKEPNAIIQAGY
ncbi:MAG TPA: hypothetical protein PLC48_14365 [Ferruginibacter sp.]|nr:hypothetical protein [Ferruginibacter sp.]